MTDKRTLRRRTLLGAVAAASLSSLTGVGAHRADDTGDNPAVSPTNQHLAEYTNRVGRISEEGVRDAFADWGLGEISGDTFTQVQDAWSNGERVVEDGIYVIPINSNITEDTVLEREPDEMPAGDQVVYQVQDEIGVAAELVIEADVAIEFQQGAGFDVSVGPIIGNGTADETILMTGTLAKRGWWNSLLVRNQGQNSLEHTIVEHGGRNNGCVNVGNGGLLELSNCTLRRSGHYGLSIDQNSALRGNSGENTYTGNRQAAVHARTDNVHTLSGDSTYTGNDGDYVLVEPKNVNGEGADETQLTWERLGVPYRMQGDEHQINNVELVIDPGAVFEFGPGARLLVQNGTRLTWSGLLDDGTVDPIVFTGTDAQRGWWDGMEIITADRNNLMEYVTVEYGGNDLGGNVTVDSSLNQEGETYLEMIGCLLRQSDGYGMYVNAAVELDLDNNEYTENAAGPARIETDNVHMLSSDSTFQGNDNDYVFVASRNVNGGGAEQTQLTWDALDVPYRMENVEHQINNVEVTVDPGAVFEFNEGGWVNFQSDSRFIMNGTQSDPITFRANDTGQGIQGWWQGILVMSTSQLNQMSNVVVKGGGRFPDDPRPNGNVHVGTSLNDGPGSLDLRNSLLADSGGAGVYYEENAIVNQDICVVNDFQNNAGGDCVEDE